MNTTKNIIMSLILMLSGLSVSVAACENCEPWSAQCEVDAAASGSCDFEGGLFCTGVGTCYGTDEPAITQAVCVTVTSGGKDDCETETFNVTYNNCRKKCSIVPFVSCNCKIAGNSSVSTIALGLQNTRCKN